MGHNRVQAHEFLAELVFDEHDTSPYWALRRIVDGLGGGASGLVLDIAEEPVDNATVKFTWFSSHEQQPTFTPATETEADIVLELERIESGQGLSVGQGNIHIGSVFD